ncbi:MAG: hypothetical protein JNM96_02215, partial [Bacteroidia bacterium]|nr:hypothetical protein [Bacteroidia bacterium]
MVLLLTFSACNTTRKLKPNQYLLESLEIKGFKHTHLPAEDFESFLKQKPNRKFLKVIPFFVGWHNMFNDSIIAVKKEKRNVKYDRENLKRIQKTNEKNEKRIKKGKEPLEYKLLNKDEKSFRENLRDIGEAPVVFDSLLAEQTSLQMSKYLFSKGYFNNKVKFETVTNKKNIFGKMKKQKLYLTYTVEPQVSYKIQNLTYNIEDEKLKDLFFSDTVNCLIKRGNNYDVTTMQLERERVTRFLLNNGYYFFESAFINYSVDSNLVGNYVSVDYKLKKFSRNYSNSDSIVYVSHSKYKINEIYVITEQVVGSLKELNFSDTTIAKHHDCKFLHNEPLKFKASMLADFIKIQRNTLFNRDTAEATFKSLMAIGVFKGVSINFFKSDEFPGKLDCYIICTPLIKQSITAEAEGINTFGNLGIDGSLIYQNRNIFKGGELIQLKLQGALTAQRQFNNDEKVAVEDVTSLTRIQQIFNTFQFGPELKFSVPRAFFPFSLLPFKNEMAPHTFVK